MTCLLMLGLCAVGAPTAASSSPNLQATITGRQANIYRLCILNAQLSPASCMSHTTEVDVLCLRATREISHACSLCARVYTSSTLQVCCDQTHS